MKIKNYMRNCIIITDDSGNSYLRSYESLVAKIEKSGTLVLGINWAFSNTTLKQLNQFIIDYTGQDLRKKDLQKLVDKGLLNVENLEV